MKHFLHEYRIDFPLPAGIKKGVARGQRRALSPDTKVTHNDLISSYVGNVTFENKFLCGT